MSLRRGNGVGRDPKGSEPARGALTGSGAGDGGTKPPPGARSRLEMTIPEFQRSGRSADGTEAQRGRNSSCGWDNTSGGTGCRGGQSRDGKPIPADF